MIGATVLRWIALSVAARTTIAHTSGLTGASKAKARVFTPEAESHSGPRQTARLALSTILVSFPPAMIEDTVTYALLQAVKATRASISPALAANGLHPGQDLLLSALWAEDGITQAELVERLGISPPTVSKALTRLERAGYVRREINANRSRRVFLTPAGRALRRPVEQAWRAADLRLRGQADPEQLTALRAIIGQLGDPGE